ncbi:MAG: hypothetical protein FJ267_13495 [Planctomycetes bacterium]|nr:hypothetical protein [Planctomycetota bacterium]
MTILKTYWQKPQFSEELARYNTTVQTEIEFLDQIVRGSYKGFREFDRMVAMSMFYFAAATWSETQRRSQSSLSESAFLNADHGPLRMALTKAYDEVHDSTLSTSDFVSHVREAIKPFNHVGLFECPVRNMYSYPSNASMK